MVNINQERELYQNFSIKGGKGMNNQQKFAKVVTEVAEMREECKVHLASKTDKEQTEKRLVLEELDFKRQWDPMFMFCSIDYGTYIQMKWNKKKRIQAIPICFFVTLYEADVKRAFPKEDIQISYTLTGFWKMERAVSLLEDFVHLQNEWQNTLLWGARRLAQISQKKSQKYVEIINGFLLLTVTHNGWKDMIFYEGEMKFCLNKTNVKLNVVPLCKLLTTYYVSVTRKIDEYTSQYTDGKEQLKEFHTALTEFMTKYFTQHLI